MKAAVPVRRKVMIEYLREIGIRDERVLAAIAAVPRETFVPASFRHQAYEDYPLEIGEGQTISQPSVVARITELAAVESRDRVLEIGSGSGYQAAVLAQLARFVFTLERLPRLAEAARARLSELGYDNVSVQVMDGSLGWRARAPLRLSSSARQHPRFRGRSPSNSPRAGVWWCPSGSFVASNSCASCGTAADSRSRAMARPRSSLSSAGRGSRASHDRPVRRRWHAFQVFHRQWPRPGGWVPLLRGA